MQPLAALYPTIMLSPLRQVRKKYPLQGVDPRSHLICTLPRMGHPSWFPLVPSTGGYGPQPRRLIRTPVQGDYPWYHLITSPPRRASLLVPLPLELSASQPPEVAHYLLCTFCVTLRLEPQCKSTANWKSLLNKIKQKDNLGTSLTTKDQSELVFYGGLCDVEVEKRTILASFVPDNISVIYYYLRENEYKLAVPQPRTEFYKRSLSYSGSVLRNGLPLEVRQLTSPSIFKGKLKGINFD